MVSVRGLRSSREAGRFYPRLGPDKAFGKVVGRDRNLLLFHAWEIRT